MGPGSPVRGLQEGDQLSGPLVECLLWERAWLSALIGGGGGVVNHLCIQPPPGGEESRPENKFEHPGILMTFRLEIDQIDGYLCL